MAEARKYYWLKLKRDFFKRHDTKIIRSMENGEKYLIFYLTLLVESIDHEGKLRFSDTVPYNDSMLATITDTDIDIVRSAVKIFCELGMMECFDDGTLYMSKVSEMIGDETEWAEKKRLYRESHRTIEGQKGTMSDKSKILEIDIELDKEKEDIPFIAPILENKFSRIESARAIWNEVMPNKPYRYTALNMGEQVRSECLRPMSVYSDDEIGEAIRNYARILASPEHEVKSAFESFHGFMRSGVEKFDSGADPWSAYKKKSKGFESAGEREDRERAEAIARIGKMGGKQ